MKVTVADCLELNAFNNFTILAGNAGLGNEVTGVSVLDIRSAEELPGLGNFRGEILLTRFAALTGAAAQVECIRAICLAGCSALVVLGQTNGADDIDSKVADAAEELGMPLIILPAEINYSAVIREVMDRVLYGDNFRNNLISNTVYHLLNFEKHSNFQSAVREAAINNDFQIIIMSEDFNPIFYVETMHNATIADAIKLGREQSKEVATRKYTMIDVKGVLTYWGPVTIADEKCYMFIVDNEDSYTAGEITKLAEIIELAIGMWKYTPERDAKAEFIKALIRGNKSLAYTLRDEARIEGSDILAVFLAKCIDHEAENKVFTDFEIEHDLEILKVVEGEETFGMIVNPDEDRSNTSAQGACAQLFSELNEKLGEKVMHITGINGIEGAGDAYKLISESWSFAQIVFPYKQIFTKYELTLVSNCINIQIQGGFVKKNYIEFLEPFKSAGETKGRQLLETLETFVLDAGMSSSRTAELLDVHANTVQYRFKRINELLGVEITGNRIIPGLTMALALKRLEDAVS